jgi:hypothetical protein
VVNRSIGKIVTREQGQLTVLSYSLPLEAGESAASVEARVTALEEAEINTGAGLAGGGTLQEAPLEVSIDLPFLDTRYGRADARPFAYTWLLT